MVAKPIPVKVIPGTDINTIPVKETLLSTLHQGRKLKTEGTITNKMHVDSLWLHPTTVLWLCIADIHHKTQPEVLQVRFYVFRDTACPEILLSFAASERLSIVKFQVPNETPSTALDTIISFSKHVSFRKPVQMNRPVKPSNNWQQTLKPSIKNTCIKRPLLPKLIITGPFVAQHTPFTGPFTKQCTPIQGPYVTKPIITGPFAAMYPLQDHLTTASILNVVASKKAFPQSSDHVGNMPGAYTIRIDPSMPPIQHARCKVPRV